MEIVEFKSDVVADIIIVNQDLAYVAVFDGDGRTVTVDGRLVASLDYDSRGRVSFDTWGCGYDFAKRTYKNRSEGFKAIAREFAKKEKNDGR